MFFFGTKKTIASIVFVFKRFLISEYRVVCYCVSTSDKATRIQDQPIKQTSKKNNKQSDKTKQMEPEEEDDDCLVG